MTATLITRLLLDTNAEDYPVGARYTVLKRGEAWYEYENYSSPIELVSINAPDEVIGHARILARTLLPFSVLSDEMMTYGPFKSISGLKEYLQLVHDDFSVEEQVTLIDFWRVD